MIYVPSLDYECYVLVNKDTIRAYEQIPYQPSYNQQVSINYRDYYITTNYVYQDGVQTFSNYSQLPVCLNKSNLTNDFYYRNDFDRVLVIFLIILIIGFIIPFKIITRMFKRFIWKDILNIYYFQ